MDVFKKKRINREVSVALTLTLLVLLYLSFRAFSSTEVGNYTVAVDDVILATVQRGDFDVTLDAYGTLTSNTRRLLTSYSKAVVEEVLLKPGSLIEAGSVILELQSPELQETLQRANQLYLSAVANKRYLILEHEQKILEENLKLEKFKSKQKIASFNSVEMKNLADLGVISKFMHLEMLGEQEEIKTEIHISESRLVKMAALHVEALEIQDALIAQAKTDVAAIEDKIRKLSIKADSAGVVQELHVELGQSVNAGDKLVTVSRTDNLVASMNVSQAQAVNLQLNQPAEISIGGKPIPGKVIRIDPAVKEGTVAVEIEFTASLPPAARPSLAVDGRIFASHFDDVLFINRPVNTRPNSTQKLFRFHESESRAFPVEVSLGEANNTYIQINAGLKQGEMLIVSDINHMKEAEEIIVLQ